MTQPRPTEEIRIPPDASVEELADELNRVLRDMHDNVFLGLETHQIIESVPGAEDLEEGQIVIGKETGTWKLFTKIQGSIYETSLTAT